jgi:prophage regulatory protein
MAEQFGTALRILRIKQVKEKTGLSVAQIYVMKDRGDFPRPVRLSEKAVGWPEHVVDAWIQGRIDASAKVPA